MSHPLHGKSCPVLPSKQSTGYSLLKGKGKVLLVVPPNQGIQVTITNDGTNSHQPPEVMSWGHHHICGIPAKDAQCESNQRKRSENSRLWDTTGQLACTLPNVNVMNNKKGQGSYYRAKSVNLFL